MLGRIPKIKNLMSSHFLYPVLYDVVACSPVMATAHPSDLYCGAFGGGNSRPPSSL